MNQNQCRLDIDGYFEDTVEVPVEPGDYTVTVTAIKNEIIRLKDFLLQSYEDPNSGHDLRVNFLQSRAIY